MVWMSPLEASVIATCARFFGLHTNLDELSWGVVGRDGKRKPVFLADDKIRRRGEVCVEGDHLYA
jgi:hypothetical protein